MLRTSQLKILKNAIGTNKRGLWQWIDDTFNRMDDDRIKEVGPNMACAEWLMKNGARIRWKGCKEFVSHYNCLPNMECGSQNLFQIEEVFAGEEASISHIGFRYFKDCKNISDVAFVGCHTINNEALSKLNIMKNHLLNLKINGCVNVSDDGILALGDLQALKYLELKNLQFVEKPETINHLKAKLPKCTVQYSE